jgi:hypothetical protein
MVTSAYEEDAKKVRRIRRDMEERGARRSQRCESRESEDAASLNGITNDFESNVRV